MHTSLALAPARRCDERLFRRGSARFRETRRLSACTEEAQRRTQSVRSRTETAHGESRADAIIASGPQEQQHVYPTLERRSSGSLVITRRRVLLALLCLAWLLPGLLARDPWKSDEAYSFGVVYEMIDGGSWVAPSLAGEPFLKEPPL